MQSPGLLLTILAFVGVIGPLVFIHEMGHYLAGRRFGVKADVFSIGFGREIAGWTDKRGTRWKIGWLPLGGYVRFAGDMNAAGQPSADWLSLPAEERNRTFQSKPVWQRAIVVAAGPLVNLLAAVIILGGFAMAFSDGTTRVGAIIPGSGAAAVGLRPGDRITAVDRRPVTRFEDMTALIRPRPGASVQLGYEREGVARRAIARVGAQSVATTDGKRATIGVVGIVPSRASLLQAPVVGVRETGRMIGVMVDALRQIVVGDRSVKELGGPITIARASGASLAAGWAVWVYLVALISINLGFINLLPIPMLDGGHLLFYAIEAVRRRPVGPQAQEWAYRGGLAALAALMLLVTFNDLGSAGLWRGLAGLID